MQLSDAIIRSTHFMMLQNQPYYVHRIIDDVARDKNIDRVRIFSKKGTVIDSTYAPEVGLVVDRKAEGCVSCHQTEPPVASVGDSDRVAASSRRRTAAAWWAMMQVIRNEPSCETAGCHAHVSQQSVLGVVDIVYSLDDDRPEDAHQRPADRRVLARVRAAGGTCVGVLVHRLVYLPLRDLEAGAGGSPPGNLDEAIPVRSDDEFGQVAALVQRHDDRAARVAVRSCASAAHTLEQKVEERTQQLRAAEAEAAQREKLAAVGLLAAGVAHEINNPLTGVLTFSHLIRQKMPDGSPTPRTWTSSSARPSAAPSIIRRLLDFARQKTPEMKFTDLNAVIEDVARFIERPAHLQRHRDRRSTSIPDLPRVWVDEDQMKQVIMNMLVNAQHATEGGGSIARPQPPLPDAAVGPSPAPSPVEMIEISIIDTGCGIPEQDLQRIFDPFFTSKDVGKGTGLGLSVSHGIVKAHGGTIKVESAVGKGSAFRVYLPIAASPRRSRTATAGQRGMSASILIVDDEEIVVRSTRPHPGRQRLRAADRPRWRRGAAQDRRAPFDVVILDIMMPRMDGVEVLQRVKETHPDIEVIMFTGLAADRRRR